MLLWYINIRRNGALGDGKTVNTRIIQNTIDQCHLAGGGTVLIEDGIYVSGTLFSLAQQCYIRNQSGGSAEGQSGYYRLRREYTPQQIPQ